MQEYMMNGESMNITESNVEKLKEIFPEVVTENKIDFDKLQEILGQNIETKEESYCFNWVGKQKSSKLSRTPSFGTLRPCQEDSKNWDTTENLYIEGDNLEVLKLLQKSYHNKIKMIYIDPPYNTGNDFVYKDDFKDNIENYKKMTGQIDEDGNKISTNSEADGRYHTNWLNMMYPRLRLARNLLTNDGIIFISIDDNEIKNLRALCDDVFGENNFIDCMIWKKRYGGGAKEKYLVSLHEYVLVYCKNINEIDEIFIPLTQESIDRYYNKKDEKYHTRGGYRTHPLEAGKAMDARPNLIYSIPAPDGTEIYPKKQWLWSKERTFEALKNNELEIVKGKNNEWTVSTKQYLYDENGEIRKGKCFSIIEDIYTQHGTNEIADIMGNAKVFQYPKPSIFIKKLLEIASDKNSIVLDFFSGSASTAHAIMQLNSEDNGARRYILVQLPEDTSNNIDAVKLGYKTICEIGKERIRRAGDRIKQEVEDKNQQLKLGEELKKIPDVGFKVFKLDSSNIQKWNATPENIEEALRNSLFNQVAGRSNLDIVYEIMLKCGLELTCPIEEITFGDKTIYSIGYGAMFICVDKQITTSVADKIIEIKEANDIEEPVVVFYDNGFIDNPTKTNIKESLRVAGIREFITI